MEAPPPLPEMACNVDACAWQEMQETARCHNAFICSYGVVGDAHLYTADQMRAYGLACYSAGLEAAEATMRELSDGTNSGYRTACMQGAAAIRALPRAPE